MKATKQKTFKIADDGLVCHVDWDYAECFNSFASVVEDDRLEHFINTLVSLYDNKRLILAAEGGML